MNDQEFLIAMLLMLNGFFVGLLGGLSYMGAF